LLRHPSSTTELAGDVLVTPRKRNFGSERRRGDNGGTLLLRLIATFLLGGADPGLERAFHYFRRGRVGVSIVGKEELSFLDKVCKFQVCDEGDGSQLRGYFANFFFRAALFLKGRRVRQ
jgi:hypothetical protein